MQPNVVRRPSPRIASLPAVFFLVGLTFLLLGFARPHRASSSNVHVSGPTVVLTFDVSGSMAARDVAPTRLRAARSLAIAFLRRLPAKYDVALITFGNKVRLVVPPTSDRGEVIARLPRTVTPLAGTSIGDGIAAAVAVVTQGLQQGVPVDRLHPAGGLVLLTDGAQTGAGATPSDAAGRAYVYGIPINSVTVGTTRGAVTQPLNVDGFRTSITIAVPALSVPTGQISQLTGGAALTLTSATQLPSVAGKLATAVAKEGISPTTEPAQGTQELSAAAGEIALAFVLGGVVLSGLWYGRLA